MAYKVFTNGSPLPASDLNTYLMNQSVMVFANSAARSAALTAPTDGMVTYLEDTDALEVYSSSSWVSVGGNPITTEGDLIIGDSSGNPIRLPIGTNGQILQSDGTTADWVTPATAGVSDWDQLATGSLTGAATISLTGFASKENYYLRLDAASSGNAGSSITVTINNVTSGYENNFVEFYQPSTYSANNLDWGKSASAINLGSMSSNANSSIQGSIFIQGGKSTKDKFYQQVGAASPATGNQHISRIGMGILPSTATITSLEIRSSSGNFDNGTYFLYGSD